MTGSTDNGIVAAVNNRTSFHFGQKYPYYDGGQFFYADERSHANIVRITNSLFADCAQISYQGHPTLPIFCGFESGGGVTYSYCIDVGITDGGVVSPTFESKETETIVPLGWAGNIALFAERVFEGQSSNLSVITINFNASSQFKRVLPWRKVQHWNYHGSTGNSKPDILSCAFSPTLVLILFFDGQVVVTNGTANGTFELIPPSFPPYRWNYSPRMHCTTTGDKRAYFEMRDTQGVNTVWTLPLSSPCVSDLDCIMSCNMTIHYCTEVIFPPPVFAPSAPTPTQPNSPVAFACIAAPPAPQFICDPQSGVYVLNSTSGTVYVNGSLNVTTSVRIEAGATLVVLQNLSLACSANVSIGGSLVVNGSAFFCGNVAVLTLTSPAVTVGQCASFGNTSISVDVSLVDALINTTAPSAQATIATFDCRSGIAPMISLMGTSAKCSSISQSTNYNEKSLSVLFTGQGCDQAGQGSAAFPVIAVAVGVSVAALVILVVVILMAVPKTRHAIFPFSKTRNGEQTEELADD